MVWYVKGTVPSSHWQISAPHAPTHQFASTNFLTIRTLRTYLNARHEDTWSWFLLHCQCGLCNGCTCPSGVSFSQRSWWKLVLILATKTYLTYTFVTQQPFGIPYWNLDTWIFVARAISIFHHTFLSVTVLAVFLPPSWRQTHSHFAFPHRHQPLRWLMAILKHRCVKLYESTACHTLKCTVTVIKQCAK